MRCDLIRKTEGKQVAMVKAPRFWRRRSCVLGALQGQNSRRESAERCEVMDSGGWYVLHEGCAFNIEAVDTFFSSGEWQMAERFVPRKDVVTICFMNDGNALLCGASDGSVYVLDSTW